MAAVSTENRTSDPSAVMRLVDAFGIPDEALGAPIGLADPEGQPASRSR